MYEEEYMAIAVLVILFILGLICIIHVFKKIYDARPNNYQELPV